jgi:ribosomal protein L11 methyltransferase
MRWIEATIDTPEAEIDARCEALAELGCGGFIIENENDFKNFISDNRQYWGVVDRELEEKYRGVSRIKFYLSDDEDGRAVLAAVRAAVPQEVCTAFVQDSDWENNWRQYYKPIEIGDRLVVVPEWQDAPEDGRVPLRLDPGLIFGTGDHPTTKLCLAALEKHCGAGMRVLDIGCGSGILAIGALLLGSPECVGCDIDPKAPEVAMHNAALNGIDGSRFRVFAGDVLSDAGLRAELGRGYDTVTANIVADVIIPLAPLARSFMAEGGTFIVSGVIDGRRDEVCAALEDAGFDIISRDSMEEWNSFTCR